MRFPVQTVLVMVAVAVAGCGGSTSSDTSGATVGAATTSDVPQPDLDMVRQSLKITSPPNESEVNAEIVTLEGTSAAGDRQGRYYVDVIGADDPSEEALYTQEFKPENGKWSLKIRLYRGDNFVSVLRLPPGVKPDNLPRRGTRGYFVREWYLTRSG